MSDLAVNLHLIKRWSEATKYERIMRVIDLALKVDQGLASHTERTELSIINRIRKERGELHYPNPDNP